MKPKFRGIKIIRNEILPKKSAEWVYGSLIQKSAVWGSFYFIRSLTDDIEGSDAEHEVYFPTVSQFTGLMSSDGGCNLPIREAYFGDIIRFYSTEGKEFIKVIEWDENLCCIALSGLPYYMFYESAYHQPSKIQFEIIGNTSDNPELLTKIVPPGDKKRRV